METTNVEINEKKTKKRNNNPSRRLARLSIEYLYRKEARSLQQTAALLRTLRPLRSYLRKVVSTRGVDRHDIPAFVRRLLRLPSLAKILSSCRRTHLLFASLGDHSRVPPPPAAVNTTILMRCG